jgi:SRSO17 transposase
MGNDPHRRQPISRHLASKDDLGLDHYEGRSWRGFHHHLVMSAIAYLFILTSYLEAKKTSGLTLEKNLKAIRPWPLRSTEHLSLFATRHSRRK